MDRVAELGCVVCRNEYGVWSPAELHHPKWQTGIGRRSSHLDVIPLCDQHHRLGGYGIAFHAGRGIWEQRYGSQADLLEQVREELDQ